MMYYLCFKNMVSLEWNISEHSSIKQVCDNQHMLNVIEKGISASPTLHIKKTIYNHNWICKARQVRKTLPCGVVYNLQSKNIDNNHLS